LANPAAAARSLHCWPCRPRRDCSSRHHAEWVRLQAITARGDPSTDSARDRRRRPARDRAVAETAREAAGGCPAWSLAERWRRSVLGALAATSPVLPDAALSAGDHRGRHRTRPRCCSHRAFSWTGRRCVGLVKACPERMWMPSSRDCAGCGHSSPSDLYFTVTTELGMGAGARPRRPPDGLAALRSICIAWISRGRTAGVWTASGWMCPCVQQCQPGEVRGGRRGRGSRWRRDERGRLRFTAGNPNGTGLAYRPAYDERYRQTMVFNHRVPFRSNADVLICSNLACGQQ
jgi:hypothetical protein